MREYEVMVIFDPDAESSAVDAVVARVTDLLTENGGEVQGTDAWGKRRLAYEIDHKTEGVYTLISFKSEPGVLTELERILSLTDEVIRHKVVRKAA